jgi:hypothetical protein
MRPALKVFGEGIHVIGTESSPAIPKHFGHNMMGVGCWSFAFVLISLSAKFGRRFALARARHFQLSGLLQAG